MSNRGLLKSSDGWKWKWYLIRTRSRFTVNILCNGAAKSYASLEAGLIVGALFFVPLAIFEEIFKIATGISGSIGDIFSDKTFKALLSAWFLVMGLGYWKRIMKAADILLESIVFGIAFLCMIYAMAIVWLVIFMNAPDNAGRELVFAVFNVLLIWGFATAIAPIRKIVLMTRKRNQRLVTTGMFWGVGMLIPFIEDKTTLIGRYASYITGF